MKEVIAIVKPFLAERVLEALKRAPLEACTVREVKGYGRQKSYLDQYGESEYSLAFLPKVEIQLWVDDARVAEVVERITAAARSGVLIPKPTQTGRPPAARTRATCGATTAASASFTPVTPATET